VTTVQDLIDRQASLGPGALGVCGSASRLSRRELTDLSSRLARRLIRLEPAREAPVAIHMDPARESVAGRVAGRSALPPHRSAMAGEARRGYSHRLPARCANHSWRHPEDGRATEYSGDRLSHGLLNVESEMASTELSKTNPEDLAYIIYISGSAGKSRGVEIEQGSLRHLVNNLIREWEVTELDRVSLLSTVGFDASVLEIWPTLAAGASLHIPDRDTRSDIRALIQWICREDITLCFMPTPMAELALELPWPKESRLRVLITGGDKLHFHPRCPLPFRLVNAYGPTENTVISTMGAVRTDQDAPRLHP
jgi:non-ribosomal peptide synthetase component F